MKFLMILASVSVAKNINVNDIKRKFDSEKFLYKKSLYKKSLPEKYTPKMIP